MRYLWEPRGPAWTRRASFARDLCDELKIVHVVDPFVTPPVPDVEAYYRLHGVSGARHVYTDAELQWLAGATSPSAYVMFNNIPRAADARRFLRLLSHARAHPDTRERAASAKPSSSEMDCREPPAVGRR